MRDLRRRKGLLTMKKGNVDMDVDDKKLLRTPIVIVKKLSIEVIESYKKFAEKKIPNSIHKKSVRIRNSDRNQEAIKHKESTVKIRTLKLPSPVKKRKTVLKSEYLLSDNEINTKYLDCFESKISYLEDPYRNNLGRQCKKNNIVKKEIKTAIKPIKKQVPTILIKPEKKCTKEVSRNKTELIENKDYTAKWLISSLAYTTVTIPPAGKYQKPAQPAAEELKVEPFQALDIPNQDAQQLTDLLNIVHLNIVNHFPANQSVKSEVDSYCTRKWPRVDEKPSPKKDCEVGENVRIKENIVNCDTSRNKTSQIIVDKSHTEPPQDILNQDAQQYSDLVNTVPLNVVSSLPANQSVTPEVDLYCTRKQPRIDEKPSTIKDCEVSENKNNIRIENIVNCYAPRNKTSRIVMDESNAEPSQALDILNQDAQQPTDLVNTVQISAVSSFPANHCVTDGQQPNDLVNPAYLNQSSCSNKRSITFHTKNSYKINESSSPSKNCEGGEIGNNSDIVQNGDNFEAAAGKPTQITANKIRVKPPQALGISSGDAQQPLNLLIPVHPNNMSFLSNKTQQVFSYYTQLFTADIKNDVRSLITILYMLACNLGPIDELDNEASIVTVKKYSKMFVEVYTGIISKLSEKTAENNLLRKIIPIMYVHISKTFHILGLDRWVSFQKIILKIFDIEKCKCEHDVINEKSSVEFKTLIRIYEEYLPEKNILEDTMEVQNGLTETSHPEQCTNFHQSTSLHSYTDEADEVYNKYGTICCSSICNQKVIMMCICLRKGYCSQNCMDEDWNSGHYETCKGPGQMDPELWLPENQKT